MYGRALTLFTHDRWGPYLAAGINVPLAAILAYFLWTGYVSEEFLEASLFAVVVGGLGLRYGYGEFKVRQAAMNTATSTVRSLAVGTAEVEGEALPADEPVEAPLSGDEAALVETEVEAYRNTGDDRYWETVGRYRHPARFLLDDGTGRVRVDPAGADLRCEAAEEVERDAGEAPPDALADLVGEVQVEEGAGAASRAPGPLEGLAAKVVGQGDPRDHLVASGDSRRRYVERVVEPGSRTYVLGYVRRRDEADSARNEENLVLGEPPRRGVFVVSEGSEEEIRSRSRTQVLAYLATGLVAFPLGVAGLLQAAGLV